jgi:hypothetical protein
MDQSEVMTLHVKSVEEHEDGSATVVFDMDSKAVQELLQYAIVDILTKSLKEKE